MVQLTAWVDLWDQSLGLIRYSESGVSLHQRMCKFLMEFGKLQTEAIAAQKKLCKKYVVDNQKIFGMENSYGDAFNEFLCVVQRIVDAEGLVSTAFELQAESDVKLSVKDEKKKFKHWKEDRNKMFIEMKNQIRIIDDEIKRYRDRYRDMVKVNEEYLRIEADTSRSRADVDKAALIAQQKSLDFNRARDDYAAALNQFNIYRKDYFYRVLPNWSQVGYEQAAERYSRTQQLLNVLYERIQVASERINMASRKLQDTCSDYFLVEKDTEIMIDKLRSGYPSPGDIQFVDLVTATNAHQSAGVIRGGKNSEYGVAGGLVKHPSTSNTININTNQEPEDQSGVIYASTSLVLPPDFHCSVSSADLATFEAAGLPLPGKAGGSADAPSLGGTASPESIIYAALVGNASLSAGGSGASAVAGNTLSNSWRTLSASSTFGASNGAGRSNLLRRFFSRSTRTIHADQVNGSSTKSSHRSFNRTTTDVLPNKHMATDDSSDFSDSSLELHDIRSREQSAYAHTDVLIGLRKPYSDIKISSPNSGQPVASVTKLIESSPSTAPLARPDSPSTNQQMLKSRQLTNGTVNAVALGDSTASNTRRNSPSFNSAVNTSNNGISYHVPSRRAPSTPNQTPNSSPIKARPIVDHQSPSAPPYQANRNPVRPDDMQWRSKYQSSDATSHEYFASGDGSPKHFFPRQPKLRASSTNDTAIVVGRCTALYPFSAKGFDSCYFHFDAGEKFYILAPSPTEDTTDWLRVLHGHSYEHGFVPTSYIERSDLPQPQIMPIPTVSGASESSKVDTGHSSISPKLPSSPVPKRELARRKAFAASQFSRLTASSVTRDTEL